MQHFPIFLDLSNQPVLIIGNSDALWRKAQVLIQAGARLCCLVDEAQSEKFRDEKIPATTVWLRGEFSPKMLIGKRVVLVAREYPNKAIVSKLAMARGIPVNVIDEPKLCSFIVPAIVNRAPITIAISSGGVSPTLARRIREKIELAIEPHWADLAKLAGDWRERIREVLPNFELRRRFWEWVIDAKPAQALARGNREAAVRYIEQGLTNFQQLIGSEGLVTLVGAGPGDPGLLTIKALRAIQNADVIVHDKLVSAEILELARRDAWFIDVGKSQGHSNAQERIHRLMLQHAQAGRRVVRLKGGDPFIFGRGGEELEFLRTNKISYEVIPGVTAATACAAYAGIPLTHRDYAQSVRMITAHCKGSVDTLDWQELANDTQTLAVYMGVAQLPRIRAGLITHGRSPNTPFALIENGTRSNQRVLTGTLDQLAAIARQHQLQTPALLLIGEVTKLASQLHWFGGEIILHTQQPSVAA